METFLKKFQFTLKTISPVFIGSGDKINKKEYIFDKRTGEFSLLDIDKMFVELNKLGKSIMYEDYLLKEQGDLYKFFKDAGINSTKYAAWIQRQLVAADETLKETSPKEIMAFVRDARGRAYVPGSSIKGAFRNILMNHLVKNNTKLDDIRALVRSNQSKKALDSVNNRLDTALLHTKLFPESEKLEDQVNSIMRGFIVSDSETISDKDMCVCQKIDVDRLGKVRGKGLQVLRECIKQDVEIKFTVTLDNTIFRYKVKELLDIIEEFSKGYNALFKSVFSNTYKNSSNTKILLGGGVGFISKTVNYSLFDKSEAVAVTGRILAEQFEKHRHDNDSQVGISPRLLKCTRVNGNLSPMGECRVIKIRALNKEGI